MLGLQFVKDVIEIRPMHRRASPAPRVARAARRRAGTAAPGGAAVGSRAAPLCSPDHVMAICEEAYRRKCIARGKPYRGKLPVRPAACAL